VPLRSKGLLAARHIANERFLPRVYPEVSLKIAFFCESFATALNRTLERFLSSLRKDKGENIFNYYMRSEVNLEATRP